jgi:23S rRNA pseudouridine1911/1915/1917 synthase
MTRPPFPILYEDNHLLVVNKPAELPTMGVAADKPSLLALAKQYIKEKYGKPGDVYLGIVSRLDAPVTGALVMARTSKAASRLTKQFRERDVTKLYWALIEAHRMPPQGTLVNWLRKDERHRKVLLCGQDDPGAQEARLNCRLLEDSRRIKLLEIELETGRKHQIRVQLSARKTPILGDRKYGSRFDFSPGIALHARRLAFTHPVRKTPLAFTAALPEPWRRFGLSSR